ncbi:hypothetical protein [Streptomyces sp. NBC_00582]|uniref:hypothetical protein n=1 Tax=Streptomyces sp. NBC_00582 TaxID=2975783 RepID=UPI002E80D2CD|nr:hypothetical protein [Streptomyces sp. NBC_00582]WUB64460.1 hypothetical protein OG852_30730 [Streptomyces sp. NBC_00582]
MTRHQRRQHAATAGAIALAAAAIALAWHGLYGEAVLAGVVVLSLTDAALRAHREHQRELAEFDWARQRGLAMDPPPLKPCCWIGSSSRGRAHNPRCTRPRYEDGTVDEFLAEREGRG